MAFLLITIIVYGDQSPSFSGKLTIGLLVTGNRFQTSKAKYLYD